MSYIKIDFILFLIYLVFHVSIYKQNQNVLPFSDFVLDIACLQTISSEIGMFFKVPFNIAPRFASGLRILERIHLYMELTRGTNFKFKALKNCCMVLAGDGRNSTATAG